MLTRTASLKIGYRRRIQLYPPYLEEKVDSLWEEGAGARTKCHRRIVFDLEYL
jgi:hypothetical protein